MAKPKLRLAVPKANCPSLRRPRSTERVAQEERQFPGEGNSQQGFPFRSQEGSEFKPGHKRQRRDARHFRHDLQRPEEKAGYSLGLQSLKATPARSGRLTVKNSVVRRSR